MQVLKKVLVRTAPVVNKPFAQQSLFQLNMRMEFLKTSFPIYCFSDFFKQRDKAEFQIYDLEKELDKNYVKIRDGWVKPLERKQRRRERLAAARALKEAPKEEQEKLVVHNPAIGIEYPAKDENIYAVVEINGVQHKVTKDDVVISDHLEEYDINDHVVFSKVLLIGTNLYTSIGRPILETAQVHATVEEHSLSDKTLVFKKRRTKNYKRTKGSRAMLTVLRIDKIVHELKEDVISKAVSLV